MITSVSHAFSVHTDENIWYGDTGATEHMTDKRMWFTNFKPICKGIRSVYVADNRRLPVRGVGDIVTPREIDGVQKRGILTNVLYILELKRNLFSIGLANEKGNSFITRNGKCELYHDEGNGPKIMEGIRQGKLYLLSIRAIPPISEANTVLTDLPKLEIHSRKLQKDIYLWHQRMAHTNLATIKRMYDYGSLAGFDIQEFDSFPNACDGCALGKQHKASYTSDKDKKHSQIPGQLIHGDLVGKMSQPSLGNSYYYVLLKDDCTSYRWIHCAKTKDEALWFFKKIIRQIKVERRNSVRRFRSDRGGEFCSDEFDVLFSLDIVI